MGAGAVSVIPIAMFLDINALGGIQVPPYEYVYLLIVTYRVVDELSVATDRNMYC